MDSADILRAVSVPDQSPRDLLSQLSAEDGGGGDGGSDNGDDDHCENTPFSMCCGDFEEVYGPSAKMPASQFSAVVTCFFLDTARNVARYLDVLCHMLRPDGVWINCGPLLYHYEDVEAE